MRETVYLDYNATSPIRPEAADAVMDMLRLGGNPSSVHAAGRAARDKVEAARAQVADLVGAKPGSVTFTSGASEANVLALRGLPSRRVLVSAIEHDSVLNAVSDPVLLPVDGAGRIDLDALRGVVREGDLVSVMAANNETGVIQPLADIAAIVAEAGAVLHVDAVQAAGRMALDFGGLSPAAMSVSAHKLGGPPGIGALVLKTDLPLTAQTRGGGQERGRRGGTENTAGIVGFGAAAAALQSIWQEERDRIVALRDRLERGIAATVPAAVLIATHMDRIANTLSVALPGVPAEKQVIALDLAGYAVSAGSACSSGKVKTSHVLSAMGLPEDIAGSAVRISLGWKTTAEEIAGFLKAYQIMAVRLAVRLGGGA
ncbi:cysteine desulfurase [Rhodospirillaceae bacterium KN72]|uniref:Cysteine desulfurase n=2 Tax=Pacificispira spongiicola TaxID=2729598 RepID=A0A7Y0DZP8_9PROT|nr:cysteine desulfurase [Pacificispira spongiicola]